MCHGKKGTGPIGANFAEDTERMSRPDAELLASIRDGKAGEVGQMPPMGAAVDEAQRFQALAYIRAAFAPAPTTTPKGSTP